MPSPPRFPWLLLAAVSALGVAAFRSASVGAPPPAPSSRLQWRTLHDRAAARGPNKAGVQLQDVATVGNSVLAIAGALAFRSDDDGKTWIDVKTLPSATHIA